MEQMATDLSAERNAAQQLDNTRMMLERQVNLLELFHPSFPFYWLFQLPLLSVALFGTDFETLRNEGVPFALSV